MSGVGDSEVRATILWHPELSITDKVLLSMIQARQERGASAKHSELGKALGILPDSVARRLRNLRERGLLENQRVGNREWWYNFEYLFDYVQESPETSPENPDPTPYDDLTLHPWEESGENCVNSDTTPWGPADPTPPVENVYCIKTGEKILWRPDWAGPDPTPSPSSEFLPADSTTRPALAAVPTDPMMQEEDMDRAFGLTEDELLILDKKLDAVIDDEPVPSRRERFAVPKKKSRWDAFKAKTPDKYNVPDMELLYKELWEQEKLPGRPFSWTGKDRGQMKKLITDQGAESIASLVKYVMCNWASLQRRYKLNGTPSVAVIFGFRRSWLPEALHGAPKETPQGPAEWTGDEDLGDTGWGGI